MSESLQKLQPIGDAPESMRWYLVQTHSNCESRVKKLLEIAVKREKLGEEIVEILLPTQEVLEMRNGKKMLMKRKLFPGYVLVRMIMADNTWNLVRHTPKVLRFLGETAQRPRSIPDKEVRDIVSKISNESDAPKFKITYEVGEVVRVVDGPFNDFDAVVEEINYLKSRLLVMVQIFGRSTPVELDLGQVEKT